MELKIETITNLEDFLSLEETWNAILEKSQSDHVCLTFEWFKSWWSAFGNNRQLFILLLKDKDDSIIGIAPLMSSRTRFRGLAVKEISFMHNENSACADFLLTKDGEETLNTIIEFLKINKGKWSIIQLQNMPRESPNYEILRKILKRNNMLFGIEEGLHSPFIQIKSDWKTYLCSLSRRFRKNLKNKLNRINRSEGYIIERHENTDGSNEILNKVFEISSRSWKSKYKREITHCEDNKKFFEEISKQASNRGWLNIWLLNINGVAVAYEYHLRYKDKIYALKADFNEVYRHISPGSVLDMDIVKHYFENNLREYNMCGHEEPYKKNWTPSVREHNSFFIYNDTLYGKTLYLLEFKFIYPLKVLLKKFKLTRKLKKVLMRLI